MPGSESGRQALAQRIGDTAFKRGSIDQRVFAREGVVNTNTPGEESTICSLTVDASLMIRHGRTNRFALTVPAYEQFTTDGNAGNSETFQLSHDLVDSPNVRSVVVWNGSSLVPASEITEDFDADSFDYTDAGTGNTLHVWYVSEEAATFTVEKSAPSNGQNTEPLYEENLALVHPTNQTDQPEFFGPYRSSGEGIDLTPYLGDDMELQVKLDAPYTVEVEAPNGDDAHATNWLMDIPVNRGTRAVPGLTAGVADAMR